MNKYNQLDEATQKVWNATGISKREAMFDLVNSFKFKRTVEEYIAVIKKMPISRMDKFASDLMLIGHGDKRIA